MTLLISTDIYEEIALFRHFQVNFKKSELMGFLERFSGEQT
jgi:hypothetical protein